MLHFLTKLPNFLAAEISSHPIDPRDESLVAFASGMMSGALHGGQEGIIEFIPSLLIPFIKIKF